MSDRALTERTEAALSVWEGGFDKVVEWCPYVTLSISLVLDLLDAPTWNDRLISIGLSAGAALWCLFMFTLRRDRREDQTWVRVYFAGLLVFAALLMFHEFVFFIFVITGFIHAFLLKPAAAGFVGVGLTSLIVNSGIVYPEANADAWWTFGIIVVIQTVAVGFGIIGGEKLSELSGNGDDPWSSWRQPWRRTPASMPSWSPRRGRRASTTRGNGWPARYTTPSHRA
jgi:hypothetical protein